MSTSSASEEKQLIFDRSQKPTTLEVHGVGVTTNTFPGAQSYGNNKRNRRYIVIEKAVNVNILSQQKIQQLVRGYVVRKKCTTQNMGWEWVNLLKSLGDDPVAVGSPNYSKLLMTDRALFRYILRCDCWSDSAELVLIIIKLLFGCQNRHKPFYFQNLLGLACVE